MDYIEFDATVEEGIIHIPEQYRQEVESWGIVHVKLEIIRDGKGQDMQNGLLVEGALTMRNPFLQ